MAWSRRRVAGYGSPGSATPLRLLIRPESAYHRGDIIMFDGTWLGPGHGDAPAVSRVVGIGGDLVTANQQCNLSVNGRPINEDYLATRQWWRAQTDGG